MDETNIFSNNRNHKNIYKFSSEGVAIVVPISICINNGSLQCYYGIAINDFSVNVAWKKVINRKR